MQSPEEKDAGLKRIGIIYQRLDCKEAACIIVIGDKAYQIDSHTFINLVLRHCSEKKDINKIEE